MTGRGLEQNPTVVGVQCYLPGGPASRQIVLPEFVAQACAGLVPQLVRGLGRPGLELTMVALLGTCRKMRWEAGFGCDIEASISV